MSYLKIIKGFWRGFVGGPNPDQDITHNFLLENQQLTITLPDSNVAAVPSVVDVHFPYNSTSWFEQHKKSYEQHEFVRVITENWMYIPVIPILPSCEYGMLSCQVRIKQTDKINVLDKQALADFVIEEYDNHHNGSEGKNTKIRKEITEQSSKMAVPFESDELVERIDLIIEIRGKPQIPKAIIREFNKLDWIFYQEVRKNRLSRSDFYCLALSSTCFLEIEFTHRVDRSDKHKKWKKHALASQERIMASITLADIPVEQDNLLAEHTTTTANT